MLGFFTKVLVGNGMRWLMIIHSTNRAKCARCPIKPPAYRTDHWGMCFGVS